MQPTGLRKKPELKGDVDKGTRQKKGAALGRVQGAERKKKIVLMSKKKKEKNLTRGRTLYEPKEKEKYQNLKKRGVLICGCI